MITTAAGGGAGYPRPDFDRSSRWVSFDGEWDFFPDPDGSLVASDVALASASETIRVPGCWEQTASGGRHDWLAFGWYRQRVDVPPDWTGERILLKFGAVFHSCEIWIDGTSVATHEGGYLPFEVDITDAFDALPAMLTIRVSAPRDKRDIPHGKQRSIPFDHYNGCSFTPSSGIWQSVWLEPRPSAYIKRLILTPSAGLDGVDVAVHVEGALTGTVVLTIDGEADTAVIQMVQGSATTTLALTTPRLWSPGDPHLYFVNARLETDAGVDDVRGYTGLRTFQARDRAFWLNGERIYLRGVLDQGYWPGYGLAAPNDQTLERDLELAAEAGFNLVRKHVKAEDPRWLCHADRLGMLVWAEPACAGRYSPTAADAFEHELGGLIERDANHPSIVIWGAYNEEWGLDWNLEQTPEHTAAVVRAYKLAKSLDPTRLAVDNSGWSHVITDIVDWHYYNEDPNRFRRTVEVFLADHDAPFDVWHSASYPLPKQLGIEGFARGDSPVMNSEYGGGGNSLERAWHTRWQTQFLRLEPDNQGYVYTELYDIDHETAGVYDFQRQPKDHDGFEQHWAHSDTVITPLIAPLCYGTDLVAAGPTTIPIMLSHHGRGTLHGQLRWWTVTSRSSRDVVVDAFDLAGPFEVLLHLPDCFGYSRLHLAVTVDGIDVARTFVDVRESPPRNYLPPDTGWRPRPT